MDNSRTISAYLLFNLVAVFLVYFNYDGYSPVDKIGFLLKKSVNTQLPDVELCSPITLSHNQLELVASHRESLMWHSAKKAVLSCDYLV